MGATKPDAGASLQDSPGVAKGGVFTVDSCSQI
jgi:hypothetical protein